MAFDWPLPAYTFGLEGSEDLYLCSRVIGMGWISAVGIAQHLARQLATLPPPRGAGLPRHQEVRRDTVLPGGSAADQGATWQVFLEKLCHAAA